MTQSWRHFPYCKIIHVHDGDTPDVIEVDQGFGQAKRDLDVRLYGSSAPEITGREKAWGLIALDYASRWTGQEVELWTLKDRNWKDVRTFVRYVACIVGKNGADFSLQLIEVGLAKAWDYGKEPRPIFTEFPVADPVSEVAKYRRIMEREFRPLLDMEAT